MGILGDLVIKQKIDENSDEFVKEFAPAFSEIPEWAEGFSSDPEPGDAQFSATKAVPMPPKPRATPPKRATPTTAAMVKDITAEFETYLQLAAMTWSLRDPECGTVLSDASPQIAAKIVKLLARNPAVLAKLHGAGFMSDIVGLLMALKPVATAVFAHHVTRKGETDELDLTQFKPFTGRAD